MNKDSVLYLLMDMRVNVILNRILERDGEYQKIIRKSGEYLNKLEAMEQPKEVRSLIDLHSCEQNALGFSDCVELMFHRYPDNQSRRRQFPAETDPGPMPLSKPLKQASHCQCALIL